MRSMPGVEGLRVSGDGTMIERHFGEAARAHVAEAVGRAEALSRGQIVPVVVEKSDPYPEARFRGAILGAAIATVAVLALGLPLTAAELPFVQLAGSSTRSRSAARASASTFPATPGRRRRATISRTRSAPRRASPPRVARRGAARAACRPGARTRRRGRRSEAASGRAAGRAPVRAR